MAYFVVSLLIFLASCAALALGQWFGRPPVHGRCTPGNRDECAFRARCARPCPERTPAEAD